MVAAQCEVCGAALEQLMLHTCEERYGELCGPFFERREHRIGNGQHMWHQEHNCVKPEPDRCWVACGAELPSYPRPACCA